MQSNLNRTFFILSNFALANLKMLQDLQVLFETASRKTAAPQQSQKRAFALHSACAFFDLLVQRR